MKERKETFGSRRIARVYRLEELPVAGTFAFQYKIEGSQAPCGSIYNPMVIRVFRCWARNP